MIYLNYFEDSSVVGSGVEVDLPNVAYLERKNVLFTPGEDSKATIKYNSSTDEIEIEPDYSKMYLTFEAVGDGTFKFSGATSAHTLSYSLDGGTIWISLAHNTDTPTIAAGSKIMWKGNLAPSGTSGIGKFVATGTFNAYGNVMSLLYGDNFVGQIDLTGKNWVFRQLFSNNSKIVNAQNLILPATTLAVGCYLIMFYYCTSLTTAPELPATTLPESCYESMFENCTSLITAPELPATTLAQRCYFRMFGGCTSLTTASATLPATTLASNCYYGMFENCSSLTTAPELSATTLAENCCEIMFSGCTSLTTAPAILPATTLAFYCYNSMFYGCTSLTTAPALPATTLASSCYGYMFVNCTSLTTAPATLPATTLIRRCYQSMFNGCTNLVIAPALPAATLVQQCYDKMFYNCNKLNYIKMLATDISASNALNNWVYGVAATGTFVKAASMTTLPTGDNGIPSGWTVETASS